MAVKRKPANAQSSFDRNRDILKRLAAEKGTLALGHAVTRGTDDGPLPSTLECQERFLQEYIVRGTISAACAYAKVGRKTHYGWLERDAAYAERFAEAHEAMVDRAESELRRRGVEGWDKPIYQNGELVGTVREYSDACLIFYLKGRRPDVFKERFEHGGPGGGPLPVMIYVPGNGREGGTGTVAAEVESARVEPIAESAEIQLADNGRSDTDTNG